MVASTPLRWFGVAFYLMSLVAIHGQDAVPSSSSSLSVGATETSQFQAAQLTFQKGQQTLAQSFRALLTLNPTSQQLQAWQQQNATALAGQQQLALDMAADSALQPMPVIAQPNIPLNASSTLATFLTTQSALANARAQIHNQLLNALPQEVSDEQISQMQQQEMKLFQQQQGANLQLQTQQAQALANESVQQPLPVPPPLVIPPAGSPQMTAFLTAKDQLMRDQITFTNQYVNATAAVRDAAMLQWMQQNASRFQQLQALAQNLSATTSP